MKNRGLKIFLATTMAIFNLFVCFVSTYAWFVGAQKPDATGINIQMEANELRLDYELYAYNDTLKQVEEVNSFDLLPYDTILKEKNNITPIVAKITLYGTVLADKTTADVNILASCTNNSLQANVLSNITHFKFGVLDITSTNISDIYYQAIESLSTATKYKFITTVKNLTIEETIQAPVENSEIVLYSIFNYDEDLITARNINIDTGAPTFTNDIQYVRYGVHE